MPFADMIGLGAATVFGAGAVAAAFRPIIMPVLGKLGSAGWRAGSFAARKGAWPLAKGMFGSGTMGWAAKSVAKTGFNVGLFAIRHPYLTMGAIGAGAYLATQKSPYESPSESGALNGLRLTSNFNQEEMAAQALNESGIAPMGGVVSGASMRNQRLMESTYGLTQGLHRNRH